MVALARAAMSVLRRVSFDLRMHKVIVVFDLIGNVTDLSRRFKQSFPPPDPAQ